MSETKRFDPYTGDPIPDEVAEQTSQAEPTGQAPVQKQPFPAEQTEQPDNTVDNQPGQAPGYGNPAPAPTDTSYNQYTDAAQPNQTAYSTPIQNETQYNPYTGQPMNHVNSDEAEEKDRKARIYGTVALIAGIASIVFSFCSLCCCPFLTIIAGVLGIIFGCLAKNSANTRIMSGTVGLITSIIGLVLCLLITVFMIISGGDEFMDGFERGFKNGMGNYYNYDNDSFHHDNFDFDSLYKNDDFYIK